MHRAYGTTYEQAVTELMDLLPEKPDGFEIVGTANIVYSIDELNQVGAAFTGALACYDARAKVREEKRLAIEAAMQPAPKPLQIEAGNVGVVNGEAEGAKE